MEPTPGRSVQAVLYVCAMNAIRSPMAEAITKHYFERSIYVKSAGVRKGEPDGFVGAVLEEIGIASGQHEPITIEDLADWEGLNFDLIVTLSPEAHHAALELTRTLSVDIEYWAMPDPSVAEGNRAAKLDAYRALRDRLSDYILGRYTP